jgi:RecJ-like exonuclease
MKKEDNTVTLESEINSIVNKFLEKSKDKEICIMSHFDTDGITSAAIMIKTLKKLDKKFSVKILKRIEEGFIKTLDKDKINLFLDLGSGSLDELAESGIQDIFIIDHHEVIQKVPKNVNIINPELHNSQKISASGLVYLFCKELYSCDKELAKLSVLGMIGDCLEKEIGKLNHDILKDGEVIKKRGLLIYPSTRPLNRTLEFCSNPYIPGVTGNVRGVLELLRETGLNPTNKGYPSLIELNEEDMAKLVTAIMLRNPKANNKEIIGDIFLIKSYNKLEDARELSAKINACSRLDKSHVALQYCLELSQAKEKAEAIHAKYKQNLISSLRYVSENEEDKIEGKGYVIINARGEVNDAIIGTIMSILSNSLLYEKGTIVVGMAYYSNKIKVSARNVGNTGRNVREILNRVVNEVGGEVGGHEFAAGCMIKREKEAEFLEQLQKQLEIELVKI